MADDPMESEYPHAYAAARWLNSRQPTAAPADDSRADSNDVAVEDVRAIAEVLGLGGHTRPYSAHEVVHREILPAVVEALAARETVRRVATLADELERHGRSAQAIDELRLVGNAYVGTAQRLRRALDGP